MTTTIDEDHEFLLDPDFPGWENVLDIERESADEYHLIVLVPNMGRTIKATYKRYSVGWEVRLQILINGTPWYSGLEPTDEIRKFFNQLHIRHDESAGKKRAKKKHRIETSLRALNN